MDTRPFFNFIDTIYAFNGQKRTVDAFCSGKLRFGKWAESLSNKRRAFEACVFTCCAESPDFKKQLTIYFDKLKTSVDNYEKSHWFNEQYDINTQKREFFEQKYHEVRRKEITIAYNYLYTLLQKNNNPSDGGVHYNDTYTLEQLSKIFDHLISNQYLDGGTPKEDFIYFFSGQGKSTQTQLKWIGSKVDAALFIEMFFSDDMTKWKKAEIIFGYHRLNKSITNCLKDNPFKELYETL